MLEQIRFEFVGAATQYLFVIKASGFATSYSRNVVSFACNCNESALILFTFLVTRILKEKSVMSQV